MRTTAIAAGVALVLGCCDPSLAAPVPKPQPNTDGLIIILDRGQLRFFDEAGREVKRYTPPKADGWPAWRIGPVSPDGSRVVLTATLDEVPGGYTRVAIAPLDGKGPLRSIRPPGGRVEQPFWAPDGRRLIDAYRVQGDAAFLTDSHYINLAFDVDTHRVEMLPLPTAVEKPPTGVAERFGLSESAAYHGSLHRVVARSRGGDWYLTWQQWQPGFNPTRWVSLVSRDGKTVRPLLETEDHFVSGADFSPDGSRVVLAAWSRGPTHTAPLTFEGLFSANVGGPLKQVVSPPPGIVRLGGRVAYSPVAYSPNGKRIAFGYHRRSEDDDRLEFRVVSYAPDGGEPRTVLSVTGTQEEVAWLRLVGWR